MADVFCQPCDATVLFTFESFVISLSPSSHSNNTPSPNFYSYCHILSAVQKWLPVSCFQYFWTTFMDGFLPPNWRAAKNKNKKELIENSSIYFLNFEIFKWCVRCKANWSFMAKPTSCCQLYNIIGNCRSWDKWPQCFSTLGSIWNIVSCSECCTSKTGRVGVLEERYCRTRSGFEGVGEWKRDKHGIEHWRIQLASYSEKERNWEILETAEWKGEGGLAKWKASSVSGIPKCLSALLVSLAQNCLP